MGYSQMHVSRLIAKALDTLRNQVREPDRVDSRELAVPA